MDSDHEHYANVPEQGAAAAAAAVPRKRKPLAPPTEAPADGDAIAKPVKRVRKPRAPAAEVDAAKPTPPKSFREHPAEKAACPICTCVYLDVANPETARYVKDDVRYKIVCPHPACASETCHLCLERWNTDVGDEDSHQASIMPTCITCHRELTVQFVVEKVCGGGCRTKTNIAVLARIAERMRARSVSATQARSKALYEEILPNIGRALDCKRQIYKMREEMHLNSAAKARIQYEAITGGITSLVIPASLVQPWDAYVGSTLIDITNEYTRRCDNLMRIEYRIKSDLGIIGSEITQGMVRTCTLTLPVKSAFSPCPSETCKGFLYQPTSESKTASCPLCHVECCTTCREIPEDKHVCNPDTVKSVKAIQSTSKPCPRCKVPIQRSEGCPDMFCTRCKTCFRWTDLSIVDSNSNPHYAEYANGRARMPRTSAHGSGALDIMESIPPEFGVARDSVIKIAASHTDFKTPLGSLATDEAHRIARLYRSFIFVCGEVMAIDENSAVRQSLFQLAMHEKTQADHDRDIVVVRGTNLLISSIRRILDRFTEAIALAIQTITYYDEWQAIKAVIVSDANHDFKCNAAIFSVVGVGEITNDQIKQRVARSCSTASFKDIIGINSELHAVALANVFGKTLPHHRTWNH